MQLSLLEVSLEKRLQGGVMSFKLRIDIDGLLSQKMGPRLDAMRMSVRSRWRNNFGATAGKRIGHAKYGSLRPQPH